MKIRKFNESVNKITQTKGILLKSSVPVTNNIDIMRHIIDIQTESYKTDKKNLTSNLINELTKIFGDPNKRLRLEFNTKVWCLNFNGLDFNVFTAKGKGTGIEVCDLSYEDVRNGLKKEEIIEFLDELYKIIND